MPTDRVARSLWRRTFARALLLLAMCGSFAATCEAQQEDSPFAGTWSGAIPISLFFSDAARGRLTGVTVRYQFRIASDGKVRVFTDRRQFGQRTGRWGQLRVSFALVEVGDGAVISGSYGTEFWAQSQTFNLTRLDEDTLLVYFWRVVDNFVAPEDGGGTVRPSGGYAEFQKEGRR
jgi:hypothetical protein